jgi:glutamate/tyrosine decarboxylase-like PLP-dependent enzyme
MCGALARRQVTIVDKGHMPLVAFALKGSPSFTVFEIQDKLRQKAWIVPAYACSHGEHGYTPHRIQAHICTHMLRSLFPHSINFAR